MQIKDKLNDKTWCRYIKDYGTRIRSTIDGVYSTTSSLIGLRSLNVICIHKLWASISEMVWIATLIASTSRRLVVWWCNKWNIRLVGLSTRTTSGVKVSKTSTVGALTTWNISRVMKPTSVTQGMSPPCKAFC